MSYFYAIALVPPDVVGLDRAALGKWHEDGWSIVSYLEEALIPFHACRAPYTSCGVLGLQSTPPHPYDLTKDVSPDRQLHIFRIGGYFDGLIQGEQIISRGSPEAQEPICGVWGTSLHHNIVPARELLVRYFDKRARGFAVPGFAPNAIITPEPCWRAQDAAGLAAWERRAVGLLFGYLHCMAVGLCCWRDNTQSPSQRPLQPLTEGYLSPEALCLQSPVQPVRLSHIDMKLITKDGIEIPVEVKSPMGPYDMPVEVKPRPPD